MSNPEPEQEVAEEGKTLSVPATTQVTILPGPDEESEGEEVGAAGRPTQTSSSVPDVDSELITWDNTGETLTKEGWKSETERPLDTIERSPRRDPLRSTGNWEALIETAVPVKPASKTAAERGGQDTQTKVTPSDRDETPQKMRYLEAKVSSMEVRLQKISVLLEHSMGQGSPSSRVSSPKPAMTSRPLLPTPVLRGGRDGSQPETQAFRPLGGSPSRELCSPSTERDATGFTCQIQWRMTKNHKIWPFS